MINLTHVSHATLCDLELMTWTDLREANEDQHAGALINREAVVAELQRRGFPERDMAPKHPDDDFDPWQIPEYVSAF